MVLAPASSYGYLLPEIIVAIAGGLLIVVDLIWPAYDADTQTSRTWPAYLGIVSLLAAGASLVPIAGVTATLFSGIIQIDPFAAFFKFLFIGIGAFAMLMSANAVPRFTRWTAEFYALILWTILGSMLLASAAELFTIFLSLQLTSLPLVALIAWGKRDPRSGEAALKYLLLVLVSTAVLLYGMSLIYGSLGTSTLSEIAVALAGVKTVQPVLAMGLVLLLTGFAFKITAAPFHYWVPDVYEGAPTPVTAFMSVGSKFAGFALAMRVIVAAEKVPLNWHLIFGVMAAISMTLGNLGAIRQVNIKRMLAYSGIAQAGYLLVGVAAFSEMGISSLLFYTLAYGAANLAAFAVVLVIANSTGSELIKDYSGLSRRNPVLALALTVALLSLAGLPLMAGFMAKFYVFLSAAQAGLVWLVAIGVINSVISVYYYLHVALVMFVSESSEGPVRVDRPATLSLAVLTMVVLVLGIVPDTAMVAAQRAAAALFRG